MSNQYKITSEPLENYKPRPADVPAGMIRDNARRVQTGMIRAESMAGMLLALVRVGALGLVVLSIFGTFYGMNGEQLPIAKLGQVITDIALTPWGFAAAIALQIILAVIQWGARVLAKSDPRWWLLFVLALGASAYWNWVAYGAAIVAGGVPWLLAVIAVVGGDAITEIVLVRK